MDLPLGLASSPPTANGLQFVELTLVRIVNADEQAVLRPVQL
jgi:hypothetical protein